MKEEERFDFYEKLYFHELDRKEKLISRLNMPMVMLVGLLSFFGYMLNKAPSAQDGWHGVFFWTLYDCAFICLLVSSWFFKAAWGRGSYDYVLPVLDVLEKYRVTLCSYYLGEPDAEKLCDTQYKEVIEQYYIKGGTTNAQNNDIRTNDLNQLSKFVLLSFVLSMLSFVPFYLAGN